MTKIKHNNFIDTFNEVLSSVKNKEALYFNNHTYVLKLIGMDYKWAKEYELYRQLLFQTIKRANELQFQKIDFGLSASFEKRKLGARVIPKVAYVQTRDNYTMELMNTLQNDYKSIVK